LRRILHSVGQAGMSWCMYTGSSLMIIQDAVHSQNNQLANHMSNQEHRCSSRIHACGMVRSGYIFSDSCHLPHHYQPCKLSVGIVTAGALNSTDPYVCKSTCAISRYFTCSFRVHEKYARYIFSETPHDEHVCDNRMCPMKCELCNRLCASRDHLHSLRRDAVHLCG
jgi:hypothetical protein